LEDWNYWRISAMPRDAMARKRGKQEKGCRRKYPIVNNFSGNSYFKPKNEGVKNKKSAAWPGFL